MTARSIPLTPPGPLWSQREYVACRAIGIEFTAHRASDIQQWFHYGFPEGINCTSILVDPFGVERYVDHDFPTTIDWIRKCTAAVAKEVV